MAQGEKGKPEALPWSGLCPRFADPDLFAIVFLPGNRPGT